MFDRQHGKGAKENDSMNRRDFVAGFGKAAGVAGAGVAVAAATYPTMRDTVAATVSRLQREMLATVVNGKVGGAP